MLGWILRVESGTDNGETCGQSCRERKVRRKGCQRIAEGSGDMWDEGYSAYERTMMLSGRP